MKQSIFLEHLTLEGYDLNRQFEASVFDKRRINEIREVIRKFYRRRPSVNTDYSAVEMADTFSAYLGGERRHTGHVHGDVKPGEVIYAMVLEGYISKPYFVENAHFNMTTIGARALEIVACRDLDKRTFFNVVRTLDYLDTVDPGHREWYALNSDGGRNFEVSRSGGFENYYTDEELLRMNNPGDVIESEIQQMGTGGPRTPEEKARRRRMLRRIAVPVAGAVGVVALLVGLFSIKRHAAEKDAISSDVLFADLSEDWPRGREPETFDVDSLSRYDAVDEPFYDSKKEYYRERGFEQLEEYCDNIDEEDSTYTDIWSNTPPSGGPNGRMPWWIQDIISYLRGLSDRDFAIAIAALLLALGTVFYITFLFKRVRTKTNITVCPDKGKDCKDKDDGEKRRFDALVDTLKKEDAIIYGDEDYLNNVRTLLDCVYPHEDIQILYFKPGDIFNSSPIPVLNDNGCRTYAESYALAQSLVAALRPYVKSDVAKNEFFYTSTITLLAEIISSLGGWCSDTPRTFAHVVELGMREHRTLMRYFNERAVSETRVRFAYDAFVGNATDQYYGQTSDLQLTLANFYDSRILEAFRPVRLNRWQRTILLVDDGDPVQLKIFRPLLDVLSEGFLRSDHRPMTAPEKIDFTKAPEVRCNGEHVVFNGYYSGSRKPIKGEDLRMDAVSCQVRCDIDDIMPKEPSFIGSDTL